MEFDVGFNPGFIRNSVVSWDLYFGDPMLLPKGGLKMKRCATPVPTSPHFPRPSTDWQTAMHCLMEAAESGGLIEFARMSMLQALNREFLI